MTEQKDRGDSIDPSIPVYQARAHVEAMERSSLPLGDIYSQLTQDHEMRRAARMAEGQIERWNKFVFCVQELLEQRGLEISDESHLSKKPLVPLGSRPADNLDEPAL